MNTLGLYLRYIPVYHKLVIALNMFLISQYFLMAVIVHKSCMYRGTLYILSSVHDFIHVLGNVKHLFMVVLIDIIEMCAGV